MQVLSVRSNFNSFVQLKLTIYSNCFMQEPLMEVMSPGTKNLQNYMINRLSVYMCREFRAAEKRQTLPCVRADELPSQFPFLSETFLRKKLREYANLQVLVLLVSKVWCWLDTHIHIQIHLLIN